ncbi:MAG: MFS transporter [Oscillospiraceae bacterium]|nr:MFS transporter [Oscillospiraceae bacterium]
MRNILNLNKDWLFIKDCADISAREGENVCLPHSWNAIDYSEWKFGKREEGTVYSLHSFFRKLAQGVGPSIVIFVLGLLGYVSDLGTTGQSPEVAYRACWLVAGLYLFSAVMQFVGIGLIFNLDKKTLATMNEEIAARKAAE